MTRRHIIKIGILLAWLVLMGWWWLESRTWPAPEKVEAAFLPDYYDSYSLTFNDQKIGWAYKSLQRQTDGSYQGGHGLTVKVLVAGEEFEISSSVSANLNPALNLIDFQYVMQAGPLPLVARGVVNEDRLAVSVNLGEYEEMVRRALDDFLASGLLSDRYAALLPNLNPSVEGPAPKGPGLSQFIPSYLSFLGIENSRNYEVSVLNPATRLLNPTRARIEAQAREFDPDSGLNIEVYRLRLGTGESGELLWIDRFGRTLREEAAGFKLLRVDNISEAQKDVTPLVPPPGLTALISPDKVNDLRQSRRHVKA